MKVLVACERSQVVTSAFLSRGCDVFSCDLEPCLGPYPSRHIVADCRSVLGSESFDLVIAHPPCTYLSNAGRRWFGRESWPIDRYYKMLAARDFFMFFLKLDCRVCIENPRPMELCLLPLPSMVVQPYEFGDDFSKKTYLWLKDLPPFFPKFSSSDSFVSWVSVSRGFERSRFFPGIAAAMAEAWSDL